MGEEVSRWLEMELLGNTPLEWALAGAVFLAILLVLGLLRRVVVARARATRRRETGKARPAAADLALRLGSSISVTAVLAVALSAAGGILSLDGRLERVLQWAVVLAVAWQAALWGKVLVGYGIDGFIRKRSEEDPDGESALRASMGVVKLLAAVAVYVLVGLTALDNLGVNVTALVAGLGVGGIAVALAVQNVVRDLLASLSIVLDKPFVAGDFIIVGDEMGTVEAIGLKTTRVRSLSGEQLVFGNDDLLSSRIRNYRRMNERRIVFAVSILYETPIETVKRVPGMIREAIEADDRTRFDRSHFKEFGPSALAFETVYHVLTRDFNIYMDVQQGINLRIAERFEKEGIRLAYPTQTLYLNRGENPLDELRGRSRPDRG